MKKLFARLGRARAGLLIERVKRRVVRDRGGRPLARVSGYARRSAVGLPEVSSGEMVAASGGRRRQVLGHLGWLLGVSI
jgi:hypothetical protein